MAVLAVKLPPSPLPPMMTCNPQFCRKKTEVFLLILISLVTFCFAAKGYILKACYYLPRVVIFANREYWMIYRGPGFLAVVSLGSSSTPFHISCEQIVSLSFCVSCLLTGERDADAVWTAILQLMGRWAGVIISCEHRPNQEKKKLCNLHCK